jgi:hypothetical protein
LLNEKLEPLVLEQLPLPELNVQVHLPLAPVISSVPEPPEREPETA